MEAFNETQLSQIEAIIINRLPVAIEMALNSIEEKKRNSTTVERYYSVAQAAIERGVSTKTVYQRIKDEVILVVKEPGRSVKIPESELKRI